MASFPADSKERWLANMKAAGVHPPDADLERLANIVADRLADFVEVLERLDCRAEIPDFQRDTASEEDRYE